MVQTKRTAGIPRSCTGRAWGFFDYNASYQELLPQIEGFRQESNFSDRLKITIIGEDGRKSLPAKLVSGARAIEAYRAYPSDCSQELFHKIRSMPFVEAYELSHVIAAEERNPHKSENEVPLRGASANFDVAGQLDEIMRRIGRAQYPKDMFRFVALYEDNHRISRR